MMRLTIEAAANSRSSMIPWDADVRGPYGAEMSLSRKPMKPGETRKVKTYIPDLNKVCVTKLVAGEIEEIPLGPQGRQARTPPGRAGRRPTRDGKPHPEMAATLWVDARGPDPQEPHRHARRDGHLPHDQGRGRGRRRGARDSTC